MPDTPSTSMLLAEIPRLAAELESQIDPVCDLIEEVYRAGGRIWIIGNGGSASNASHFAQDLVKATVVDGQATRRIRAMALTDNVAHLTAIANDRAYAFVFEEQLRAFAWGGDALIAFSGSGNSKNIIYAAEYAEAQLIPVIGFTGRDGGQLKRFTHKASIHVPCDDMGVIESMHALAFHLVVTELRERLRT